MKINFLISRICVLAIVILFVRPSRPGTDPSRGEIETPGFHRTAIKQNTLFYSCFSLFNFLLFYRTWASDTAIRLQRNDVRRMHSI